MPRARLHFSQTLEDDPGALERAIRDGLERPLLLWGHPSVGRASLVEAAAKAARLPFRQLSAEDFEGFDGFRDLSDSGHFRQVTLEKFLARGERADPATFTLNPNEVLYIRGLNLTPRRLVQSVLEQLVDERKLLNNPLPDGVRIVASVFPSDEESGRQLLGEHLLRAWDSYADRAPLQYPVYGLPDFAIEHCDHWAVLPSVRRFVSWARATGLAEEVVRFIADEADRDLPRAFGILHASLIRESEPLQELPSPRAYIELGTLLVERRPYFSSRAVKDAIARSGSLAEFQTWLYATLKGWDPTRWIEAGGCLTVRGEPVTGSDWMRQLSEQIDRREAHIGIDELTTYAAYELRSLEMWATQELGDELGAEFAERTTITDAELAHLG